MSLLNRWVEGKAFALNYVPELNDDGSDSGYYLASGGSGTNREQIENSFVQYVEEIYKRNGIVYACIAARQRAFSEVRFLLQQIVDGRPGTLYTHESLNLLDRPWPNGTTGELLARMEQDVSLAGNSYWTIVGTGQQRRLRHLRPDWVTIMSGLRSDPMETNPDLLETEPLAYIYAPPGSNPQVLRADDVVHYSPDPDPIAHWRGMSWLTPLIREVRADHHATTHKLKYFENGAAITTVVAYPENMDPKKFARYVELFEEHHRGPDRAYKTLHIGGGADASAIGSDMKADFKAIQGAGETRIAAAAGVGAIIARFSEGLAGSALNQGNYAAARRQFADMTIRPLWRSAAASLSKFVEVPGTDRLWYDARDVEFLKEDRKDAAEIDSTTAQTIKALVDAGFTPASVVASIGAGDFALLEHSGLYSVQLQEAGATPPGPIAKDLAAALVKVGARNSTTDQGHIQAAHDSIVAAGADCTTEETS